MVKEPSNFMEGISSLYIPTLPSLIAIDIVEPAHSKLTRDKSGGNRHRDSGNVIVLVCHVILQDHLTKRLSNISRSPSKVSHHLAKFEGHGHCSSE